MPASAIIPEYSHFRKYDRLKSVVFCRTHDPFGGLSNMAAGFPLKVNDIHIRTSEALYQACRFPHLPNIQKRIIEERSPMTAKMASKPHRQNSRPDWDQVRIDIMRWCLHVKLAQNWEKFSALLVETGNYQIVEKSRRDDFWGAKMIDDQTLAGMNVMGKLLMELREAIIRSDKNSLFCVEPLAIPNFLLMGRPVGVVAAKDKRVEGKTELLLVQEKKSINMNRNIMQTSLIDKRSDDNSVLCVEPPTNSSFRLTEKVKEVREEKIVECELAQKKTSKKVNVHILQTSLIDYR